jgi:uncharacterized membrane protein
MESRLTFAKHPTHPILIIFPAAFFPLLVFLDILRAAYGADIFWTVGFWIAVAGIVMTILAAIPGFVDYLGIPGGTRAKRTATIHLTVGVIVLVLYALATWARTPVGAPPAHLASGVVFDVLGLIGILVQGWLGGELVYRHHLGVLAEPEGGEPTALEGHAPQRRPMGRPGERT